MTDSDRYVKTGVFLAPFHATRENPLLALERDMDLLVHLDKLNYHEAWVGEHHSAGFEIIACPELFIAAAAERTRHIRLGTGVVSLPYHNPFTLAGRMQQLDYQTRGRAMFGVGPGSLVYDAAKMGLAAEDQRRKLDESLDVIMELMQGRMVTSLCFGGKDLRDLYIVTGSRGGPSEKCGTVYRMRSDVAGLPLPVARVSARSTC